jgi:hypothetical protein
VEPLRRIAAVGRSHCCTVQLCRFCIDLSKLKAVASSDAFDFPAEAHKHGLPIPALFVGSEQVMHANARA